ncbi:hypothetical protein D9613_012822 [Agrocybe pediades]|uniref:Nephrocystin 3-like N-terminal domain-containing protein n=1 Tax=Agrocybe pediades TaxID=84607 RepID=A0A8H4VT94_9AGAR|nr:hypothetical protein D9613_012822 [Agrocybe pediades]
MTQPGTPVPPSANISHSILHNPTFNQHNYIHSGQRPGYARLLENVATAALHDSVDNVDPPKCHPNTRVAIIDNIRDWTLGMDEELSGKPILWLKGGAGAGKSAIARSVAERCSAEGLLLGSFFFSAGDTSRNHVKKLVATLSSQISIVLPEFRDTVAAFIEDDPLIFGRSIRTQFSTLIIRPLSAVLAKHSTTSSACATPRLIIIDGLDECSSIDSQRDLLLTLHEVTSTTTLIRFLVCSRPESHLNNTFSLSHVVPIIYKIFLDYDYSRWEDIRVYLEDKFKQIKEGHVFKHILRDPWPTREMVNTLVDKSSGQFIYAATVIRYVESPRHRPDQRLDAIFNLRPPFKDLPFTKLDVLYQHIISKADDLPTVLDILAFPALYGIFALDDIEAILQLEQGSVEVMLADLHSIVTIFRDRYVSVRFLHKSLADFLSKPQRAGDLYRDLFKVRLSHVALVISIFSSESASNFDWFTSDRVFFGGVQAHHGQQTCILHSSQICKPIIEVLSELRKPDNMKANYVSSDILQALQLFPTFKLLKAILLPPFSFEGHIFIRYYFQYLYCIKDMCESTRLMYWERMRQYCESILALLDNTWSSDWPAHFVFAYGHLLHDPRYLLPRKLSNVYFTTHLRHMDVGNFGYIMLFIIGLTTIADPRRASRFILFSPTHRLRRSPPTIDGQHSNPLAATATADEDEVDSTRRKARPRTPYCIPPLLRWAWFYWFDPNPLVRLGGPEPVLQSITRGRWLSILLPSSSPPPATIVFDSFSQLTTSLTHSSSRMESIYLNRRYRHHHHDGKEANRSISIWRPARTELVATTWAVVCEEVKGVREDDSDVEMEVDRDVHEKEDEQGSSSPVLSGMDVGGRRWKEIPLEVKFGYLGGADSQACG